MLPGEHAQELRLRLGPAVVGRQHPGGRALALRLLDRPPALGVEVGEQLGAILGGEGE